MARVITTVPRILAFGNSGIYKMPMALQRSPTSVQDKDSCHYGNAQLRIPTNLGA